MKKILGSLFFCLLLAACSDKKNIPDVSNISANLYVERFDSAFFQLDTNRLSEGLFSLQKNYPGFYKGYMEQILGLPAFDTSTDFRNNLTFFYAGYRPLYDTLMFTYSKIEPVKKAVEGGLQFVKYYFPKYNSFRKLTFFIGPFDAPGAALIPDGIAVGLQQYAGKDFSFYASDQGRNLYPEYISRRFSKEYIPVNCMKLVVEDLCPDTTSGTPLIERIVRKGREAWLLDQFLPRTPDTLKLGYTKLQLDWCEENEALIWSYMLKNVDLQSIKPDIINNFLGEGPFTAGIDQANSPGNLGTWIGLQIVRAYLNKFPETTPANLIQLSPDTILEGSAYKPR